MTTLIAGIGAGLLAVAPAAAANAAPIDPAVFADTVTVEGVQRHLEALQTIADQNSGNRAYGTPGYEASGKYVEETLQAAGYTTERQYFDVIEVDPTVALTSTGLTFAPTYLSGGPDTEPLTAVAAVPTATSADAALGCAVEAWDGVDLTGKVAVVSRGTCTFAQKVSVAKSEGAVGAVIYNNADAPLQNVTLGEDTGQFVPTVGLSRAEGLALAAAIGTDPARTVTLSVALVRTPVPTFNVLAETPTGTDENVVMIGAHLDSVEDGPGINDNGSGSAAILETAVQLAEAGPLNNKVRFAWWGAEEVGLVGSTHYVNDLVAEDPAELERIATYLNFDMVGSPNYIVGVYDADESTFPAPVEVPAGSAATEAVFTDYFDSIDQAWVDTEFSGRSDYQAFINNGVAASGLFSGADDVKTDEEVRLFGGTAGIIHDPNYHTPDDDVTNINPESLGIMAGAIGFATASLANDTFAVNGYENVVPGVPTVPGAPVAPGTTPAGQLAATGADASPFLAGAGLLLLAGAVTVLVARRRVLAGARAED